MTWSALIVSSFVIASAAALAASPAASEETHRPAGYAHRHAIPASAEALSPSRLAPAPRRDDDWDGLTRDTSECNRGCIDN
ncbi:hypothetical protein DFR50_13270 [Roseiarcus fermentans]|uniref:Secreted protein n=1 Tax=Roseiarcus fermentans TaxID=1473586 RepID=A0A366EV86_9HYPH|nr:hypothetical protein [Roseiarcus fermentans]RBP06292.1 hypothetical protein DFR50_13270 [Roseiarcus fermentans]